MFPSWLTVLALAALGIHIALLARLVTARELSSRADRRMQEMARLVAADQCEQAVGHWGSLGERTPLRLFLLFLLGLELSSAVREPVETSYRAAPKPADFERMARDKVEVELTRLQLALRSEAIPAVLSGVATAGTGLGALLSMADRWGAATLSMVTAGIGGSALAVLATRQMSKSLETARDLFLPLLRPVEEMTEQRRRAARLARGELSQPPAEVFAVPVIAAVVAIGAATWCAWISQR